MPYDMNTILKDRTARLCLLSALTLLGTACGDDVTAATTGGSTGEDSATTGTPATTTTSTTGTSTTDAPTTDASTSTMGADSSTTDPGTETTDSTTDPSDGSTTMVDPTKGETDASTGDESTSDATTTGEAMQECPYGELMAPDVLSTTTLGEDSEFTNSCGGGGAPDVSYTLTAPADGTYFFTASSPDGAVDPLVAVYDGTCGGPELDCNEDINAGTTDAEVNVALTAGQDVTVVLDGFALGGGAIDLEVTFFAGGCPDGDLGNTVPTMLTGTTVGTDNTVFGACGGNTANDDQLTFTAPTDGVYTFDTAGSDFDTVLFLLDGCGGDELGCNDNVLSDETSHLNLLMTADQEVIVAVDGANLEEGNYTVTVDRDECPDFVLDNTLPVFFEGSTVGEPDASAGSCGGAGASGTSFSFTAPQAGVYTIDTAGSEFDTVLYTLDACGGNELACNNDAMDTTSRLNVTLAADDELLFVVDGINGASGNYDVNIAFDECPDFDLGQDLPITVTGNTEFETDASSGSCGPGNSNDVAYTFTAPQAGNYVFDTNGSTFDTVLYYYDGATCVGTEIECDDDDGDGLDSLLTINMVEDQEVTLIVDGRFGGFGDYVLNVTLPECGNDFVELGEECDGTVLPDTCFSLGMGGGTLACDPVTCQYDTAACGDDCGNGTLDAGEVCDLSEYGGTTCQSQGFAGGPLGCGADCTSFDESECSDDIVVVCSSPGAALDSLLPPATDTITIPDIGVIADVDVYLDVTHTFTGDLEISLSADDLALQNTLSDNNCGGIDDVLTTFNDEGDFLVGSACIAPVGIEGNIIPDASLSVYDGGASAGEWTLTVDDQVGGDTGTLDEWCLFITLE